jgi:DNA-binding XRE family transcriptional regulator
MAPHGNAVARARMTRELTQTELAWRAGISRQALGAIDSGAYHPGVAIATRLARELGSSVESLFGEIDDDRIATNATTSSSSSPRSSRGRSRRCSTR